MGPPGLPPEGLVDVGVGVDEPGQHERALPVERLDGRLVQPGLDPRDRPVANEDVHRVVVTAVQPDAS